MYTSYVLQQCFVFELVNSVLYSPDMMAPSKTYNISKIIQRDNVN